MTQAIPMSEIRDTPRQIAVAFSDVYLDMRDTVKLASDIQNYANQYSREVNKDLLEALEDCAELMGYLKELPFSPKLTQVIKDCTFLANHAIQKAKLNK